MNKCWGWSVMWNPTYFFLTSLPQQWHTRRGMFKDPLQLCFKASKKKKENTAEAKLQLFLVLQLKHGPQVLQRRSFNIIHFQPFGKNCHYYYWINNFFRLLYQPLQTRRLSLHENCTHSSRLPLGSLQMKTQPHRLPLEVALATAIPAVAKQFRAFCWHF